MKKWEEDQTMTDEEMKKLMERIGESAEDIRVPASLEPEAVKARLKAEGAGMRPYLKISARRLANVAAVLVLVATLGGVGIYGKLPGNNGELWDGGQQAFVSSDLRASADDRERMEDAEVAGENLENPKLSQSQEAQNISETAQPQNILGSGQTDDSRKESGAALAGNTSEEKTANAGKQNGSAGVGIIRHKTPTVGSYHLAANYEEVSEALKKASGSRDIYFTDGFAVAEEADSAEGILAPSAAAVNGGSVSKETDAAQEAGGSSGSDDFSKTNTQVEGVDESDFIKNDGNYLYLQSEELVRIVDIRGEQMKLVAEFDPKFGENYSIRDMYVDGDRLFLIAEKWEPVKNNRRWYWRRYNVVNTELRTYDISDRSAAKFLGKVVQDGSYHSSRKVGDYVYLFTQKSAYEYQIMPIYDIGWAAKDGEKSQSAGEEDIRPEDYIPRVNNMPIAADCIYLQDNAGSELIVSSVDARDPGKAVDSMVLLNNYANLYMSTDAIYLYSDRYEWEVDKSHTYTDIVKFSYKDGFLNGVGTASVLGAIQDVFAISEANGILRVLTTEWRWSGEGSENRLYLLDADMKELGSLDNIARGEEIYAARYLGNIAYFITYHNTDPLFAVDISNPRKPKMLGQLEITGFSDYLHPYGDGLLLGIGYETDPKTSRRLGVKLVMFDISDPVNLKIVDSVVIDGDHSAAADDYKSVLADPVKNLIGLEVTNWSVRRGENMGYLLYTWKDGHFVKLLGEKVDQNVSWDMSKIRGIYAGSRFYLINSWYDGYQIRSFDMNGKYRKLSELTFGEKQDYSYGGIGWDDYLIMNDAVDEDASIEELWKEIKTGGDQTEDIGWDD